MTTPTHLAANLLVYLVLKKAGVDAPNTIDAVLLFSSNLIDLDHLLARPIYHPRRNPFIIHPIHKQWRAVIIISLALLFYRPLMYLGLGLLTHLFLDYLYIKREKLI
jgi:hypothetical protein